MDLPDVVAILGLGALVVGVSSFAYARSQLARARYELTPSWEDELPDGAAQVLAALSSAVVVLDSADRVVKATAASFAFGLVRDSHLDSSLLSLVQAVRQTGLVDERELEFPRVGGPGMLLLQIRVVPLGALHILVLAEDHTETRRVEEVRRDFVANVSHELKTPIGAISLLSETLIPASDDPETVVRFATKLQRESSRLSRLVQEIIDLSQLQSSHGLTEPELADVHDIVSEALDRCRLAAEAKDIRLQRTGSAHLTVFGDRALLATAVGNLVSNAVHYSDPGTRIRIDAVREGNRILIAVEDQGIGISPTERDRVFERFYRVDPARSRLTGGTGLGLSIVKHIAANHGGDVTVESELGQGSTFTLRLPAAPADRPPADDAPETPRAATPTARLTRKATA